MTRYRQVTRALMCGVFLKVLAYLGMPTYQDRTARRRHPWS